MQVKIFEVRDRMTFMPVMAIKLITVSEKENYLLGAAGYGNQDYVIMIKLDGMDSQYDPFAWGDRTRSTAHTFIIDKWDLLETGDVIDVEFIRGESANPKRSQQEMFTR